MAGKNEIRVQGMDERDARVVTCAADLFLQHGIANVKMVDIADAAGVGVATVYRHFSTKSQIAVSAATYLWGQVNEQIESVVESDEFLALNGLMRLGLLLQTYCQAYTEHADFVALLDEFDHMVVAEHIGADELMDYGAQIDSFYLIFEDAYLLGLSDGSVARKLDFRTFYVALAHALMGVAQKLGRGEIIPSDDFSPANRELGSIVDMAMWSLASDCEYVGLAAGAKE